MDRRYANNDNIQHAMKDYGISQGWYVKSNNNYNVVHRWLHINDESLDREVNLDIDLEKYSEYPYMDTFKYGFLDNNILSTLSCQSSGTRITLESTSGGYSETSECASCGDNVHEDDIFNVYDSTHGEIDVCRDCRDAHYTCCEDCDDISDTCSNVSGDRYVCESCLEDYSRCDECEEHSHSDSVRYFSNCEVSICENCL